MPYILGIDTGGTCTDSVILDASSGQVVCWNKAATTHDDLTRGIRESIKGLAFPERDAIAMVALSTTLATNAVVKNQRGKTGLLLAGKEWSGPAPAEMTAFVGGRMSIRGAVEQEIDRLAARDAIRSMKDRVDAICISGYAGVRNPVQEEQLAALVRESCDLPVFTAHEISGELGFRDRTVTCALNASLLGVIVRFAESVRAVLRTLKIDAPVLIAKGDGSLARMEDILRRPVETILSGPASSVAGAYYLSGLKDALVLDMGGTTTDIARIRNGEARIDPRGASVGGYDLLVRAIRVSTHGVGSDLPLSDAEMKQELLLSIVQAAADLEHRQIDVRKDPMAAYLMEKTSEKASSLFRLRFTSRLPILCVGGPVKRYMEDVAESLRCEAVFPEAYPVANAVGAAQMQIRESETAVIRKESAQGGYRIYPASGSGSFSTIEAAAEEAERMLAKNAKERALRAGAVDPVTKIERNEILADGAFAELRIQAVAGGRPIPSDSTEPGKTIRGAVERSDRS